MQNEMVLTCMRSCHGTQVLYFKQGMSGRRANRLNNMGWCCNDMGEDDDFAVFIFEKRL
jgi:hypothetical protein